MGRIEKSYKDFNKCAKAGINKFTRLSSKSMKAYGSLYKRKTGKSSANVMNKENFYCFVKRNRIRKKK